MYMYTFTMYIVQYVRHCTLAQQVYATIADNANGNYPTR